MKKTVPVLFVFIISFSCEKSVNPDNIDKWKSEIIQTEKDFAALVEKEGIPAGFLAFASDDVVLSRGKRLVVGKDALMESYGPDTSKQPGVSLSWAPDFVDVSSCGDMAYTYGTYVYAISDSTGHTEESTGIFHTVWKRQPDDNWRFVWD